MVFCSVVNTMSFWCFTPSVLNITSCLMVIFTCTVYDFEKQLRGLWSSSVLNLWNGIRGKTHIQDINRRRVAWFLNPAVRGCCTYGGLNYTSFVKNRTFWMFWGSILRFSQKNLRPPSGVTVRNNLYDPITCQLMLPEHNMSAPRSPPEAEHSEPSVINPSVDIKMTPKKKKEGVIVHPEVCRTKCSSRRCIWRYQYIISNFSSHGTIASLNACSAAVFKWIQYKNET